MPFMTEAEEAQFRAKTATQDKAEDKSGEKTAEVDARSEALEKTLAPALARALSFGKPVVDNNEEKQEEKKDAKTDGKAEDKKEEKQEDKAEEKKLKVSKKEPAPSIEESIQKAADEAAKKTAQQFKPVEDKKEDKQEETHEVEVPDEYKDVYNALKFLENKDPKKYKGKSNELVEFVKKENEYIAEWEAENEGKEFDSSDDEHDAFYRKNSVKYSKSDVEEAKIDMRVEARLKEESAKHKTELRTLRKTQIENASAPQLYKQRIDTFKNVMKGIDPTDVEKLDTKEGYEELRGVKPMEVDVSLKHAAMVEPLMRELHYIYDTDMYVDNNELKLDPNSREHVYLVQMANSAEEYILGLPQKDQVNTDNGKSFVSREKWSEMTDAQRQKHWTIDKTVMSQFIIDQAIRGAKQEIEATKQAHDKYFSTKKAEDKASQETEKKEDKKEEKVEEKKEEPKKEIKSPAASSVKVDTTKNGQLKKSPEISDLFGKALFGH